ncbi:MAG: VOC family protein [Sedimentisphaerales bacterium]
MKLHEIGLLAKDPKASKKFYHDTLGLHLHHEEEGLSVFDGGWPGVEIGACSGYPDRVHISFIVDDVDKLAERLRSLVVGRPKSRNRPKVQRRKSRLKL